VRDGVRGKKAAIEHEYPFSSKSTSDQVA